MLGKTLVHYKITAEIGRGGMGEVYQAKDTKLGRDIAIKVLPEEFAKDSDRVARFQREAKLLASLNHPNIAAIHGLEESDGTHFLVMELIEGDTLRDRIKSGPIPVEEALKLALQMAEALEAAHENGVIHRDLKPANIKVTPDGKVKVLDFGLAKAYAGDQDKMSLADSPTISVAATQKGVILGTAAYMSPEQAKGKSVDKRADIWAFGVVLFEMLTGKSLFSGEDVSSTLARVLEREPDFKTLPQNLHPRIQFMLERCLEKNPKKRYSGISDALVDIDKALTDPSGIFAQPISTIESHRKLRSALALIAATAILTALIVGAVVWYLRTPEPKRVMRFDYEFAEGQEIIAPGSPLLAISPDGSSFVYCTSEGLYLRSMDTLDAKLISGTEEIPLHPFFSPDGQWIGYYSTSNNQLKKIAISGGAPVTLCEASSPRRPIWNIDDTIVYVQAEGIMKISANGGTPELIVDSEGGVFFAPQILPDGKSVLFSLIVGGENRIAVQSLQSGERKILTEGINALYLPTGHLVYGLGNNLFAVPFDLDTLEVIGGPVPMVEGVMWMGRTAAPQYTVSDSGTLIFMPGTMDSTVPQCTLVWVDREGKEEALEKEPKAYGNPKISPDGKRVALEINEDGNADIYIYDLIRGTTMRLTFDEADDYIPIWTPDGQRIVFGSDREGLASIFWKAADGTGKVEQIASMEGLWIWPESISNDGNTLFFGETGGQGRYNIGMLPMEGDRTPELLLQEEYNEGYPQISPDGRWLAYQSNESGQAEVFVRPFPDVDSGGKWQVSTDGGQNPLWSPDGSELFYVDLNEVPELMVVSVETDPIFSLGTPQSLITGPYIDGDIDPDGKRFLAIKEDDTRGEDSIYARSSRINIVLNWFEELKERVPVD